MDRLRPASRASIGLRLVVALGLLGAVGCGEPAQDSEPDSEPVLGPPNIVLIVADDLGAEGLGCYGGAGDPTPRIDRLAREGVRFETCYTTPLCRPSRVLLLTGQYGFRTGFFGNDPAYKPEPGAAAVGRFPTFADLLRRAGYATGYVGKWGLSGTPPELVFDCGFQEYLVYAAYPNLPQSLRERYFRDSVYTSRYWRPTLLADGGWVSTTYEDYGPDLFADWAVAFMERHAERPFLLYYPMALLHVPIVETPDPARSGARLPASFEANLRYTDHIVGRLADAVDELGLARRTVFVFTTDNGTQDFGKGEASERGARVPYIARWPGEIPAGSVSRALTDHADVLPTLAELAGLHADAIAALDADLRAAGEASEPLVLDGQSLVPTLRDPKRPHREWIFSYVDAERMVRTERWLWESAHGLFDCGTGRDGGGYRHVLPDLDTAAADPDVEAARHRMAALAATLPGPIRKTPATVTEDDE